MANLVDFFLDGKPVETGEGKAQEQADSAVEYEESVTEGLLNLLARPLYCCGIRNAPVGSQPADQARAGRPLVQHCHRQ